LQDTVRRILSHVPEGWTATVEGRQVHVAKGDSVIFYCGTSMRPRRRGENEEAYYQDHGRRGALRVSLRCGARLSFEEYGTWLRGRRDRLGRLSTLRASLDVIPFTKSFEPRTPEEKNAVAGYERLRFELATEERPVWFTEGATVYLRGMLSGCKPDESDCELVFPRFALVEARSFLLALEREFAPYVEGDAVTWYAPDWVLYEPTHGEVILDPRQ
jgi:hypothetical protein